MASPTEENGFDLDTGCVGVILGLTLWRKYIGPVRAYVVMLQASRLLIPLHFGLI
jgi:hypothetical protein